MANVFQKIKSAVFGGNDQGDNWQTVVSIPTQGWGLGGSRKRSAYDIKRVYRGWVSTAIKAIAQDTGTIEYVLYKITGDKKEEVKDHPVLDLLYGFNENTTKSKAVQLLIKHKYLFGQAFWKLDTGGKQNFKGDDIKRIIPLVPDSMQPVVDEQGVTIGWVHTTNVNGKVKKEAVQAGEVIHFSEQDPFELSGTSSTVQEIYEWIENEIFATEWNKNFFKKNAVPPAVFESEKALTPEQRNRTKESWDQATSGMDNSHSIPFLPAGVKINKVADSHKDMDFEVLDVRFQNKIIAGFGVPRTRLGITDDVNRANAEATIFVYMLWTIKPIMQEICDILNEFLVPLYGDDLELSFKSPVPDDRVTELEDRKVALGGLPYMSINEVRERDGLASVEGGDAIMGSAMLSEIGRVAKSVRVENSRPSMKKLRGRGFAFRSKLLETAANTIAEKTKELLENVDLDELAHKAFVLRVTSYQKKLAENIKKVNAKVWEDVKNNITSLVDQQKSFAEIEVKDLIGNEDEMLNAVIDASAAVLYSLTEAEGKAVFGSLGIADNFVITDKVKKLLDEKIGLLARSYNDTTVSMIKEEIRRGLEDGLNVEDIKNNLKENVFDFSNDVRADMIGQTETFRIANLSTREAYAQSGVVQSVRWYTAEDEMVCEECAAMDGTVVGTQEAFLNIGDSIPGSGRTVEYDDVMGGALHVNCRCYTRPDDISVE